VGLSPLIIHQKSPEENSPLGMSLKYDYWMLKRGDSGIFSPIIGDDKLINYLPV
jgi:hypothetical protein